MLSLNVKHNRQKYQMMKNLRLTSRIFIAVNGTFFPFRYQLRIVTSPNSNGNQFPSFTVRPWIRFMTITAMKGTKKSSSMKPGKGNGNKPSRRLLGMSRK